MSKEPQTSVSDQVGERTASDGCCDFHIRHMASIWYLRILRSTKYYSRANEVFSSQQNRCGCGCRSSMLSTLLSTVVAINIGSTAIVVDIVIDNRSRPTFVCLHLLLWLCLDISPPAKTILNGFSCLPRSWSKPTQLAAQKYRRMMRKRRTWTWQREKLNTLSEAAYTTRSRWQKLARELAGNLRVKYSCSCSHVKCVWLSSVWLLIYALPHYRYSLDGSATCW